MTFHCCFALLLALTQADHHKFGLKEAQPRIDNTIRVCTYNVLNLFDHTNDPTLEGEFDDMGDNPGPTSIARCKELAKAIREVDADILALQEVESLEALNWFNENFLNGMGYEYVASLDAGYYRGVEQSVLSRIPICHTTNWPNESLSDVKRVGPNWTDVPRGTDEIKYQRSPLCVTLQTEEGYTLTLFVLHHKAGRSTNWHREYEAIRTMEKVNEMMFKNPNANIMVLGDFNAAPWDKSVKVYLEGGLIDTMAHRSTNVQYDEDAPLYKTHTSDRVIDFILLNPAAYREFVPKSAFILGTSAEEYDWRNDPIPPGYASDHYPLAIDIIPSEGKGVCIKAHPYPEFTAPEPEPEVEVKTVPLDEALFVASKRSDKFHKATCKNVDSISPKNKVGFETRTDATDTKRVPAKCCSP